MDVGSRQLTETLPSACAVDLSVVIPVYFNEGSLRSTFEKLRDEVFSQKPALRAEVVFVDDGSGDGSFEELQRLRQDFPDTIRVIKLTRNFGQVSALLAGFRKARGKCIVAMSADGQDPVGLINQMLAAHLSEGYEIVVCTREGRDESAYRVLTSRLFYSMMRKLSFANMPAGGFDFVLLGRRALDALLRNREAHPFLQGQILWTGFRTKFIGYRRKEREVGASRWTFGKKLTYLIDGVLSYSFVPIRLMSIAGSVIALLGFIWASIIVLNRYLWGNPIPGWSALMFVVLVLAGIQLLMLGIIGEYLWRTLAQVRNREPYVIDTILE
jgi:glycosyltransferase involved in cell wall biosynthesis